MKKKATGDKKKKGTREEPAQNICLRRRRRTGEKSTEKECGKKEKKINGALIVQGRKHILKEKKKKNSEAAQGRKKTPLLQFARLWRSNSEKSSAAAQSERTSREKQMTQRSTEGKGKKGGSRFVSQRDIGRELRIFGAAGKKERSWASTSFKTGVR